MRLTIILVAPARAENVGAAARAMKTMGFRDLRIVDSEAHPRQRHAGWRMAQVTSSMASLPIQPLLRRCTTSIYRRHHRPQSRAVSLLRHAAATVAAAGGEGAVDDARGAGFWP